MIFEKIEVDGLCIAHVDVPRGWLWYSEEISSNVSLLRCFSTSLGMLTETIDVYEKIGDDDDRLEELSFKLNVDDVVVSIAVQHSNLCSLTSNDLLQFVQLLKCRYASKPRVSGTQMFVSHQCCCALECSFTPHNTKAVVEEFHNLSWHHCWGELLMASWKLPSQLQRFASVIEFTYHVSVFLSDCEYLSQDALRKVLIFKENPPLTGFVLAFFPRLGATHSLLARCISLDWLHRLNVRPLSARLATKCSDEAVVVTVQGCSFAIRGGSSANVFANKMIVKSNNSACQSFRVLNDLRTAEEYYELVRMELLERSSTRDATVTRSAFGGVEVQTNGIRSTFLVVQLAQSLLCVARKSNDESWLATHVKLS